MRGAGLVSATRSGNHAHHQANATMIATCLSSLRAILAPGPAGAPAAPIDVNDVARGPCDRAAPIQGADDPPVPGGASANPNPGVGGPVPAEVVMADVVPDGDRLEFTADEIIEAVSEYYGMAMQDLRGRSRSRTHVSARQVAVYLCRELTELSLPQIGHAIGGRHHTR